MIPSSIYSYIWHTTRSGQIKICLLVAVVAPLTMAPLELQRRIVDHVVSSHELWFLAVLGSIYLGVTLVQGGLKYRLNLAKGRVLEEVTRDLRTRIVQRVHRAAMAKPEEHVSPVDPGTTVSMLSTETEDVGGFASESLGMPLLQAGTILWVVGYLMWVEPLIAALAVVIYMSQVILVPRVQKTINRLARRRTSLVRRLGRDAVMAAESPDPESAHQATHAGIIIKQIFRIRMLIYRYKFFLTFLGNFLDSLGPIVVLVVGGYLVIQKQTDVSTLVVFISGFQRLSGPWDQLVNFYRSVSNARVTYSLIADVLAETPIADCAKSSQATKFADA